MKSRAERRPRRELQQRLHWESEEEGPAETGRVPREGAEEPRLCGTLEACPRSRAWSCHVSGARASKTGLGSSHWTETSKRHGRGQTKVAEEWGRREAGCQKGKWVREGFVLFI